MFDTNDTDKVISGHDTMIIHFLEQKSFGTNHGFVYINIICSYIYNRGTDALWNKINERSQNRFNLFIAFSFTSNLKLSNELLESSRQVVEICTTIVLTINTQI